MPIVVSWREIKDRVATEEQRIHVADGLFVNADQLPDILGDFNGVTCYDFSRKTCFSKDVYSKDKGDFFKNFHHKDLLEFQWQNWEQIEFVHVF